MFSTAEPRKPRGVLVVRLDNAGDVLLTGPAVRAVAAHGDRVVYLCGPQGEAAAGLLPGVDEVIVFRAPWIDPEPLPVDRKECLALAAEVAALHVDRAVIFTSFHQSALPLALLLRFAGVRHISAISDDYPGSLLDVRHRLSDDVHEVERALSLAEAAGFALPAGDDRRLRIRQQSGPSVQLPGSAHAASGYVVVHPGASVPARAWPAELHARLVGELVKAGQAVVVTGSAAERDLAEVVAGPPHPAVVNLAGRTDLAGLAGVIAGARAIVVGNTGPAHLAAAVGTPVVSLFAPTVPAVRWRPWRVPHVLLGDQGIACSGCRARQCPVPGHPCVAGVGVDAVVSALEGFLAEGEPTRARRSTVASGT